MKSYRQGMANEERRIRFLWLVGWLVGSLTGWLVRFSKDNTPISSGHP